MEITYQSIKKLLLDSKIESGRMICRFGTSNSGMVVEAQAPITKSNTVQNRVVESVKRSVFSSLRNIAYTTIRQTLGSGALGQTGTSVVQSALSSDDLLKIYSQTDKENAVVNAFKSVANRFIYEAASGAWQLAAELSEYEKALAANPISNSYDREIFERMLVQVAGVSKDISIEEKDFLYEHLGMSPLKIEELSLSDPILVVEADEVSPGARKTIFLLVYTIALVDHLLDEKEMEMLNRYALMFDFSEEQLAQLKRMANDFIIENALRLQISREDLLDLAIQMKIDPEAAIRARVKFLKNDAD